MIYEWIVWLTDGSISRPTTVGMGEYNNQLAYCQEGRRTGWIKNYECNSGGIDE